MNLSMPRQGGREDRGRNARIEREEEESATKKIACAIVAVEGSVTERGDKVRVTAKPHTEREQGRDRLARGSGAQEGTGRDVRERVLVREGLRTPPALTQAMKTD
ncbi:hypothetical protein ERJ75_001565100 [Trypanosoma vivax]|nr:hypothetical protein ERJ75_001565100 [Trypanosoma vivax]